MSKRISFRCSHCRCTLNVPQAYAGRKGRCPDCKGVLRVPALEAKRVPVARAVPVAVASGVGAISGVAAIEDDVDEYYGDDALALTHRAFEFSGVALIVLGAIKCFFSVLVVARGGMIPGLVGLLMGGLAFRVGQGMRLHKRQAWIALLILGALDGLASLGVWSSLLGAYRVPPLAFVIALGWTAFTAAIYVPSAYLGIRDWKRIEWR